MSATTAAATATICVSAGCEDEKSGARIQVPRLCVRKRRVMATKGFGSVHVVKRKSIRMRLVQRPLCQRLSM